MSYLWLKYLHILSVIGWVSSTLSLGIYIIYKTLIRRDLSGQEDLREFYRFLTGFEFGFFVAVVLLGLSMIIVYGYSLEQTWIKVKLLIVGLIFFPLELINFFLVFRYVKGGSWYLLYDKFVLGIAPVLIMAGACVVYMAVFKVS